MFDVEGSEGSAYFKVIPNICLEEMKKNMIHLLQ